MLGALIAKQRSPAFYQAMNRHDLDTIVSALDDEITFLYPGDVHASGVYTGKAAVRAWFERFFEQFPILRFTVKQVAVAKLLDLVGSNTVVTHWEVEVTNRDDFEGRNSGVSVVTLRRGKVTRIEDFIFDTGDAFRRAWGERARAEAR